MNKVCVLVVGMHRSGTSALTRVLVGLGCDAPRTLMPADDHNAAGYWESSPIAALNDAILDSAGSTWDDWGAFNPAWTASPAAQRFRERAQALLTSEFGDSPIFALKDPRICRLLEFWTRALRDFGATPCVAMPIRNPVEVAASLERRDRIEPPFGLLLWLRSVLDAEAGSRGCRRATLSYDDLLENWERSATRLGRELAIDWPRRSTLAALEIEDGITPALRHQQRSEADALRGSAVSTWVRSAYAILNRWAQDESRAEDVERLDAIRAAFNEAEAVFRRPLATGARARRREAALDAEVTERRAEARAMAQKIAAKDDQIAELVREVETQAVAKDDQIAELTQDIATKDGRLATLERVVQERDRKLDALNQAIARKDAELRDRAAAINALHVSTSWRITRPLRAAKGLSANTLRLGRAARAALKRLPMHEAVPFPWAKGHVASDWLDLAECNQRAAQGKGAPPVLFDPAWYLERNEDVRRSGLDPLQHYLGCGVFEGRLPFDALEGEIDEVIESLHRLNIEQPDAFAFDAAFYRVLHEDLETLDDDALAHHYERHGRAEGRIASKGEFAQAICVHPAEIPLDFHAAEYIDLYPDLAHLRDKPPLDALRHYMQHGRWEPRLHTFRGARTAGAPRQRAPAREAPCSLPSASLGERPVCALAHVYYPELWPELAEYIRNLPQAFCDLYVNLVDATFSQGLLAAIRADFPNARVYISENKGRDIGGHFQLLRNVHFDDYRVFCLLHTKKSPHMAAGEVQLWRRRLLLPLLGSAERAVENMERFLNDDGIGMLGAEACRYAELNDNPQRYFEVLNRLGIQETASDVEFITGTMMFLRSEVLRRLFETLGDIPFEPGDDESLEFHLDGQWAHAIERAIGALCRHMGYRTEWR